MKWKSGRTQDGEWTFRFAWLPVRVGGVWFWLERYAVRCVRVWGDGPFYFRHELSHPALGRFHRTDQWGPYPMDYFTGDWVQP